MPDPCKLIRVLMGNAFIHIANSHFCTAIVLAATAVLGWRLEPSAFAQYVPVWPVSAQPALHADADSLPDLLVLEPGFSPTSLVFGRVLVQSGASGDVLFKVVGPEAGDDFAIAGCVIDDVNGDAVRDLAICAPGAARTSTKQGRLYIHSGADGSLLRSVEGSDGEAFAVGVTRCRNADVFVSPVDSLLVLSLVLDAPEGSIGQWKWRRVNPDNGTQISSGPLEDFPGPPDFHLAPNLIVGMPGDLNADRMVDVYDLLEQIQNVGVPPAPRIRGDLSKDGSIDASDVAILLSQTGFSGGEVIPAHRQAWMPGGRTGNCLPPWTGCKFTVIPVVGWMPPDDGGDGGGPPEPPQPPVPGPVIPGPPPLPLSKAKAAARPSRFGLEVA